MLKAVLFDMDGVIIDSEPLHIRVVIEMMKSFGINITYQDVTEFIGVSNSGMWADLTSRHAIGKRVDELLVIQHRMNIAALDGNDGLLMPGIVGLLHAVKEHGIKTAIASSSTPDYIDAVMDKFGLRALFDAAISGEQVKRGKPMPDIFLKAAEMLETQPRDCTVIEDSDHGVRAAVDAGMTVIGLKNPNSGRQELTGAHCIVDSIDEIGMDLLLAMNGRR